MLLVRILARLSTSACSPFLFTYLSACALVCLRPRVPALYVLAHACSLYASMRTYTPVSIMRICMRTIHVRVTMHLRVIESLVREAHQPAHTA